MKIGIIGSNYTPEKTGIGPYSCGMAEYFSKQGHCVTMYTGFSYYPLWAKGVEDQNRILKNEVINGVNVFRTYVYVPKIPTPLKRIAHELSFVISSSLRYLFSQRVDLVIVVMPPLFLALPVLLISKLKRSTVILHVQDLQPDAAVDLGMLKKGFFTKMLYLIERYSYRLSDYVSTISIAMKKKITEKGISENKILILRNWANDDIVKSMDTNTGYRNELGLVGKIIILYSGNMGVKQGLPLLVEVAKKLTHNKKLFFLVAGDGGEKDQVMALANSYKLDNIRFLELQPLDRLSELLATADISVIPQRKEVKDIVLPSKLGNILASSRAVIVATCNDSELGIIVNKSSCGLCVEPESVDQFVDAIQSLAADEKARLIMGANGLKYALEHLSKEMVLKKYLDILIEL